MITIAIGKERRADQIWQELGPPQKKALSPLEKNNVQHKSEVTQNKGVCPPHWNLGQLQQRQSFEKLQPAVYEKTRRQLERQS